MKIRLYKVKVTFLHAADSTSQRTIVTLGFAPDDAIRRVQDFLYKLWPPAAIRMLEAEPESDDDCIILPEVTK